MSAKTGINKQLAVIRGLTDVLQQLLTESTAISTDFHAIHSQLVSLVATHIDEMVEVRAMFQQVQPSFTARSNYAKLLLATSEMCQAIYRFVVQTQAQSGVNSTASVGDNTPLIMIDDSQDARYWSEPGNKNRFYLQLNNIWLVRFVGVLIQPQQWHDGWHQASNIGYLLLYTQFLELASIVLHKPSNYSPLFPASALHLRPADIEPPFRGDFANNNESPFEIFQNLTNLSLSSQDSCHDSETRTDSDDYPVMGIQCESTLQSWRVYHHHMTQLLSLVGSHAGHTVHRVILNKAVGDIENGETYEGPKQGHIRDSIRTLNDYNCHMTLTIITRVSFSLSFAVIRQLDCERLTQGECGRSSAAFLLESWFTGFHQRLCLDVPRQLSMSFPDPTTVGSAMLQCISNLFAASIAYTETVSCLTLTKRHGPAIHGFVSLIDLASQCDAFTWIGRPRALGIISHYLRSNTPSSSSSSSLQSPGSQPAFEHEQDPDMSSILPWFLLPPTIDLSCLQMSTFHHPLSLWGYLKETKPSDGPWEDLSDEHPDSPEPADGVGEDDLDEDDGDEDFDEDEDCDDHEELLQLQTSPVAPYATMMHPEEYSNPPPFLPPILQQSVSMRFSFANFSRLIFLFSLEDATRLDGETYQTFLQAIKQFTGFYGHWMLSTSMSHPISTAHMSDRGDDANREGGLEVHATGESFMSISPDLYHVEPFNASPVCSNSVATINAIFKGKAVQCYDDSTMSDRNHSVFPDPRSVPAHARDSCDEDADDDADEGAEDANNQEEILALNIYLPNERQVLSDQFLTSTNQLLILIGTIVDLYDPQQSDGVINNTLYDVQRTLYSIPILLSRLSSVPRLILNSSSVSSANIPWIRSYKAYLDNTTIQATDSARLVNLALKIEWKYVSTDKLGLVSFIQGIAKKIESTFNRFTMSPTQHSDPLITREISIVCWNLGTYLRDIVFGQAFGFPAIVASVFNSVSGTTSTTPDSQLNTDLLSMYSSLVTPYEIGRPVIDYTFKDTLGSSYAMFETILTDVVSKASSLSPVSEQNPSAVSNPHTSFLAMLYYLSMLRHYHWILLNQSAISQLIHLYFHLFTQYLASSQLSLENGSPDSIWWANSLVLLGLNDDTYYDNYLLFRQVLNKVVFFKQFSPFVIMGEDLKPSQVITPSTSKTASAHDQVDNTISNALSIYISQLGSNPNTRSPSNEDLDSISPETFMQRLPLMHSWLVTTFINGLTQLPPLKQHQVPFHAAHFLPLLSLSSGFFQTSASILQSFIDAQSEPDDEQDLNLVNDAKVLLKQIASAAEDATPHGVSFSLVESCSPHISYPAQYHRRSLLLLRLVEHPVIINHVMQFLSNNIPSPTNVIPTFQDQDLISGVLQLLSFFPG